MKRLVIAAAALLLAASASAQGMRGGGGGGKRHQGADDAQAKRPKVDEKAYKAALERIPVPKEKFDPWRNTR